MRNRTLYLLIAALVLLGTGFYLYNEHQEEPPLVSYNSATSTGLDTNVNAPSASTTPVAGEPAAADPKKAAPSDATRFSGESDVQGSPSGPVVDGNDIQVLQVDYDGTMFAPDSLTIYVGDYIFFKNNSDTNFWPESASYPAFNAGHPIAPGKDFQFEFTKAGTWAYVDHLNPEAKGTIIVKKR